MANKYPYVKIEQLERAYWYAVLITDDTDEKFPQTARDYKFARTRKRVEQKGRKMLAKYNRKYADLADEYVIR